MTEKVLWLKNVSNKDISLSDLGIKVPVNKTINVYQSNPYLSKEQVQKSLEEGTIAKKLQSKNLQVMAKYVSEKPHNLDHIKTSTKPINIVKSKSSIVIDTQEIDVINDDDLSGIADYGFDNDIELDDNTNNIKTEDGSIVIKQKQDDIKLEQSDATVKLQKITNANNVSTQSIVAVAKQVQNQINPVGPISEAITPPLPPTYVVKPPVDEEIKDEPKTEKTSIEKQVDGSISVAGKTSQGRSLKVVKELNDLAKKMNVPVEELPQEIIEKYDADQVVKNEPTQYDTKVATKDKTGAVVMKIKNTEDK